MQLRIEPSGQSCGALVYGVDLTTPLSGATLAELRRAWLEHKVIGLPDQQLTPESLLAFADQLGPHSNDPFLMGLAEQPRVVEVRREPDEKAGIFADSWHSDWSFLATPPSATLLYGVEIPSTGGDTLFANLAAAYDALPAEKKHQLKDLTAIHSAKRAYAPSGRYGDSDKGRSMKILANDTALATQSHPLVREHPETGKPVLFISPAYTIGIESMAPAQSDALLKELFEHTDKEAFQYRHRWAPGMLTIWDNRSLNHKATGGYEGHRRLLQRVTVGEPTAVNANA